MPTRQTVLQALVIALAWLACDALVRHFAWPVPASVVGMIALLVGLLSKRLPLSWVQAGAGFYLGDMLLFFIPPMLAISKHGELLSVLGLKVLLSIALSVLLVMAVVGWVVTRVAAWERRPRTGAPR